MRQDRCRIVKPIDGLAYIVVRLAGLTSNMLMLLEVVIKASGNPFCRNPKAKVDDSWTM